MGESSTVVPSSSAAVPVTSTKKNVRKPITILKPATMFPSDEVEPAPALSNVSPPVPSSDPQLDQLDSVDNMRVIPNKVPPDPPDYESDDTLELDCVFTQIVSPTAIRNPTLKYCL